MLRLHVFLAVLFGRGSLIMASPASGPPASLAATSHLGDGDQVQSLPDQLERPRQQQARHSEPTPMSNRTAREIIAQLHLIPNDEGGYYIETFRDAANVTVAAAAATTNNTGTRSRSASTAIYYLLEGAAGFSRWHRVVDAAEVWHYYAGAPLTLSLARGGDGDGSAAVREACLGPDVFAGQRPQVVVARGEWQRARSWGEWTLVGTTVAPGFEPTGVELAAPGWMPNAN